MSVWLLVFVSVAFGLPTLPKNLIAVPLYSQQTEYSCGPSSVLSLLRYWAWDKFQNTTEEQLYGPLHTSSKWGTAPSPIANFFSANSLPSTLVFNASLAQLEASIDVGLPSIVLFQAWNGKRDMNYTNDWGDGHYNVAVGYDDKNLFFMDPWTKEQTYVFIPKENFLTRWHDIIHGEAKVYNTLILVKGSKSPHPIPPVTNTAKYEE